MVGGIIRQVKQREDRIQVIVQGTGGEQNNWRLQELSSITLPLRAGDQLWWQDRRAYWTPANGTVQDVPLLRLGYGHVIAHNYQLV